MKKSNQLERNIPIDNAEYEISNSCEGYLKSLK